MKATFLDRATIPPHIDLTTPNAIKTWENFDNLASDEIINQCMSSDIILTNKAVLTKDIINQLPALKLICVTATGTNNVNLDACRKNNIAVVNATNYGTASVAEHTLMLILALSRNLPRYLESLKTKEWSKSPFFYHYAGQIQSLAGKTLTIVGYGTLGRAVAERASAIGMNIIRAEQPDAQQIREGYTDFYQAIKQADVLSLHCPLTEKTTNLIDKATLALLKPSCILINTGRGGLVNEKDLLAALTSEQILAAGLDVAETEPPSPNGTIWQLALLPNVIVTPHVAWAADDSMQRLINQIMTKIEDFVEHRPIDNLAG
ncbi:D-2-hydroxyacid dehydrogenase [Reinekea sp.]|jgi:glycerate dehydrogenase|uniref:D-2-hydroxyacid dehydrogenase n=1 Tax=Reinekea sp. TaxID=1970455 RepID=UPI003989B371